MSKKAGLICIVFSFILGLGVGSLWDHYTYPEYIIPKDSIIYRDSLIRDSIYIINDSIITEIQYIEKEYDKDKSVIMSNNDSSNYSFFSDYVEHFNNK